MNLEHELIDMIERLQNEVVDADIIEEVIGLLGTAHRRYMNLNKLLNHSSMVIEEQRKLLDNDDSCDSCGYLESDTEEGCQDCKKNQPKE